MAHERERELLQQLTDSVLKSHGSVETGVRESVARRAGHRARSEAVRDDLPAWIGALTDTVAQTPSNADVEGCLRDGHTEDEVFEIVLAAAVGSALARGDAGLAALTRRQS
jgi:hypothetical protein